MRGELTREALGTTAQVAIGAPGLLAGELYGVRNKSRAGETVGLVPHYADRGNGIPTALEQTVRMIDVRQPPRDVVQQIASCDAILSSSLHGLVVADGLGIPCRQVVLSGRLIGGDFKFCDYYLCFGRTPDPLRLRGDETIEDLIASTQLADRRRTKELQAGIQSACETFAREYLEKKLVDRKGAVRKRDV